MSNHFTNNIIDALGEIYFQFANSFSSVQSFNFYVIMGACCGDMESTESNTDTAYIHKATAEDNAKKILLLGSGGSGRSTFFKQNKVLYSGGFDKADASMFSKLIYAQIIPEMKSFINHQQYVIENMTDSKIKAAINTALLLTNLMKNASKKIPNTFP